MIYNIPKGYYNDVINNDVICQYSGSMEPAFYRGDLLFLTNNRDDPVQAGEILVFKVKDRDIPIVHRVIKVHERYTFIFTIFLHSTSNLNGYEKYFCLNAGYDNIMYVESHLRQQIFL